MFLLNTKSIKFVIKYTFIVVLLFFSVDLILKYSQNSPNHVRGNDGVFDHTKRNKEMTNMNITIAITICGNDSLNQGLNALKSALILSDKTLKFLIMTEKTHLKAINEELGLFQEQTASNNTTRFSYELHEIQFPNDGHNWRKLFRPCAAQRLFLPDIFTSVDSLLYIDTDVLFLSPVEEVYAFFDKMNSTQMAALSYESQDFSSNWYHRFAKHPYYGFYGVNSGVMLMNLTRMRSFNWTSKLEPILLEYQSKMVWGDQDIINIIFHYHPDKLFIFDCIWNFRSDHCIYSLTCKQASKNGIKIVHGNRGVFLNQKLPPFKSLFGAFKQYNLRHNTRKQLPDMIQALLSSNRHRTNCDKISHHFWEAIR